MNFKNFKCKWSTDREGTRVLQLIPNPSVSPTEPDADPNNFNNEKNNNKEQPTSDFVSKWTTDGQGTRVLRLIPNPNVSPTEPVADFNNFNNENKWNRSATLCMIETYKAHLDHFKSTSIKNEAVWKKIETEMNNCGFSFNKTQIENKFKYLKQRYIRKKEGIKRGTGESPILFDYFDQFEEIFGKKPNVTPIAAASSSKPCVIPEEPTPKKTRTEKKIAEMCDFFRENREAREQAAAARHEEKQATMRQALDVYEQINR